MRGVFVQMELFFRGEVRALFGDTDRLDFVSGLVVF